MTRRDELSALIARVESAGAGEQWKLLPEGWNQLNPGSAWQRCNKFNRLMVAQAFTDAALSMVPEGWCVLLAIAPDKSICDIHEKPLGHSGQWIAHTKAATPALALLAAILKIELEKCDADRD